MSDSKTTLTDILAHQGERKAARMRVHDPDMAQFGAAYYLDQAKTDAYEALVAIQAGDWLRADIFLKLAIDEIADAGILP